MSIEDAVQAIKDANTNPAAGTENPDAAPPVVDTEEPKAGDVEGGTDGAPAPEGGGEAPAFVPNYKFKASGKELEFDEFVRPLIKDEDTQNKVRELYEKAHGIDSVKADREKIRGDYQTLRTEHDRITEGIRRLEGLRDVDIRGFLEKVGVPWNTVLEKVAEELRVRQMPEDQQRMYREAADARRQAYDRSTDIETREADIQVQQAQLINEQINVALMRPDVAEVVNQFDTRPNKPFSFRELVCNIGSVHYSRTKEVLPVQKAVEQAMALVGPAAGFATTPQGSPPVTSAPAQAGKPRPAAIPNIGSGRAQSPAAKAIRSIEDIEAAAQALGRG